jgi:hypothetical protein
VNVAQTVTRQEPGDTDARAESVGDGCVIVVAGRKWFVDLADIMELRIPSRDCGRQVDELALAE